MLFWLFVFFVCMLVVGTVVNSLSDISKRRQTRRAQKELERQRPPSVSKYAVTNPAKLRAKRRASEAA